MTFDTEIQHIVLWSLWSPCGAGGIGLTCCVAGFLNKRSWKHHGASLYCVSTSANSIANPGAVVKANDGRMMAVQCCHPSQFPVACQMLSIECAPISDRIVHGGFFFCPRRGSTKSFSGLLGSPGDESKLVACMRRTFQVGLFRV